jgi:hypothetical protein
VKSSENISKSEIDQSVTGSPPAGVRVCRSYEELSLFLPEWEDLSEHVIDQNCFYEPSMLLPAIRSFGQQKDLYFVLIFDQTKSNPVLTAFFPLEKRRSYKGIPVTTFTLWKHIHCFYCTPLIRRGFEEEALKSFFNWLNGMGIALLELPYVSAEGLFHQSVLDYLYQSQRLAFTTECFTRALLKRKVDAESYMEESISGKKRKEYRRLENRLGETGRLEYIELDSSGNVKMWIDQFLELEASGWKGQEGSALRCKEDEKEFFTDSATKAFEKERLMMIALLLDGKPVAQKCNFLTTNGSFSFKIAYDEEYTRFSPGVLLELENIRRFHNRSVLQWMDSCAITDHPMINRLWKDRRTIQTIVIDAGTSPGAFIVSLLPLIRWANRKVSNLRQKLKR